MTVFNQEHFIKYIYSSIQKQIFKEIELIIIDDASTDNSTKIVKNFMKNDKRIILRIKLIKEHFIQEIKEFYFQKENTFLLLILMICY